MLEIFVIGYCIYFLVNVYTSFMQIGFIKNAKDLKPIILEEDKYKVAGNYAIEKEKLSLFSTFYDFIIFMAWISFGLSALNEAILVESSILKAVIFVNVFIAV